VGVPPNNQQPAAQFQVPAPVGPPPIDQQFQPPQPIGSGTANAAPANTPKTTSAPQQQRKANTTQNSLLLSELREGMVIMADGSFRAVIACKSINFDLMSAREREGVEYSYQNFLNALYFPIQIFIRSQRVDIGPYLDRLEETRRSQDNMLLNVLMDDYIQFIDALAQDANIMDKSFFIIVPFFPAGDAGKMMEQGKGLFDKFFGASKAAAITKIDKATYDKAKEEIKNRVDSVINGLMQVGIQATQLNTKQLGELYYNVYNPDTAVREPLGDFGGATATYVRKAASTQEGSA
jgi:type IV secretory pathway VirB4 component